MLRQLAARATQNPIEIIVSIFVIVTLAYFQLLHAIATSNFFEPLNLEARGLAAASTYGGEGKVLTSSTSSNFWEREASSSTSSSLNDLVFVRKANTKEWVPLSEVIGDTTEIAGSANSNRFVIEPILLADSEKQTSPLLSDLAKSIQSQIIATTDGSQIAINSYAVQDESLDLTGYAFGRIIGSSEAYQMDRKKLLELSNDAGLLQRTVNESVKRAVVEKKEANRMDLQLITIISDEDMHNSFTPSRLEELRSVRWMAYAMRALVMRFWALVRVSRRSADDE